jgi:hypothetical protein
LRSGGALTRRWVQRDCSGGAGIQKTCNVIAVGGGSVGFF